MKLGSRVVGAVLFCAALTAPAAERALGLQTAGERIAEPVLVQPEQAVSSGGMLAEVRLLDAPGSSVILGPNTTIRLQSRDGAAGTSLIILLDAGTVQVSIADKGRFADVHVVGAALDVRVTGTLFVVERASRDSDYVALVRGKVTVRLRQEVLEALAAGSTDHVDLVAQQGVGGGPGGLGSIDHLNSRPQVGPSLPSIKDQGAAPGAGWDDDLAQDLIDGGGSHIPPPSEDIGDDISNHVSETINKGIETQIGNEVINQTLGGSGILGPPPGPPGP
jgi:hypothetical protein